MILNRASQSAGLGPEIILREGGDLGAFGRIARIKIGNAAPLGRIGQKLHDQPARPPVWRSGAGLQNFGDRKTHQRRDLFGAQKILVGGGLKPLPAQRHYALIA